MKPLPSRLAACCTGALLLGATLQPRAQDSLLPGLEPAAFGVNGSLAYIAGAQNRNAESLLPRSELVDHAGLASQRVNAVLRANKPGVLNLLLDVQYERLTYSSDRHDALVNQAVVSIDVAPQWKLRAGRQRVLWGNGFTFIPTDFINPPISPTAIDLAKQGVDALSFDYLGESVSLTGIVARSERIEADGRGQRSTGIGLKLTTSAVSGVDVSGIYYWSKELGHAAGISAQADTSVPWLPDVPGLVLFGSLAFNQRSRYPQLADGAGGVPQPATAERRGPYASFLIGGTYSIDSARVDMTAEFYGIGDAYPRDDYRRVLGALADPQSAAWPAAAGWLDHLSYGRNQRRYLNLSLAQRGVTAGQGRFTDTLSYDLGVLVGLGDRSRLWSFGLKSNHWDHAEFGLRVYAPAGGRGTEFGTMPFDWRVETTLKLAF